MWVAKEECYQARKYRSAGKNEKHDAGCTIIHHVRRLNILRNYLREYAQATFGGTFN
jgi:ribosomal protein S14